MRHFLVALILLTLSPLSAQQAELSELGFPKYEASLNTRYFGRAQSSDETVKNLEAYLSSRPIDTIQHSYQFGVTPELLSEVTFTGSREKVRIKAVQTLEGKWQLSEVEGVRFQLRDFKVPMPSMDLIVFLAGCAVMGSLAWSMIRFNRESSLKTPSDDLPELSRSQEAALFVLCLSPEVTGEVLSEMEPEEVQAITLDITSLPEMNAGMRYAVLGRVATLWNCSIASVEKMAADNPQGVTQLVRAWRDRTKV